jgi:hypothetical protein
LVPLPSVNVPSTTQMTRIADDSTSDDDTDDTDDDDDDLKPLPSVADDQKDLQKVKVPKYLRDCLDYLRKVSFVQSQQALQL